MIDKSDFVIFYAEERKNSGAYKAYKYARKKKGKQIKQSKWKMDKIDRLTVETGEK